MWAQSGLICACWSLCKSPTSAPPWPVLLWSHCAFLFPLHLSHWFPLPRPTSTRTCHSFLSLSFKSNLNHLPTLRLFIFYLFNVLGLFSYHYSLTKINWFIYLFIWEHNHNYLTLLLDPQHLENSRHLDIHWIHSQISISQIWELTPIMITDMCRASQPKIWCHTFLAFCHAGPNTFYPRPSNAIRPIIYTDRTRDNPIFGLFCSIFI